MRSVNKVILIGNVTRDPELRQTQSGQSVCTFGLATNREWVTSDSRKKSSAEYHEVVAWAQLADICDKYVRKGKLLYIEGYLKTRSWDTPEGIRKFKTEVVIQDMIMLEKRSDADGIDTEFAGSGATINDYDDYQETPAPAEEAAKDDEETKTETETEANESVEETSTETPTEEPAKDDKKDDDDDDKSYKWRNFLFSLIDFLENKVLKKLEDDDGDATKNIKNARKSWESAKGKMTVAIKLAEKYFAMMNAKMDLTPGVIADIDGLIKKLKHARLLMDRGLDRGFDIANRKATAQRIRKEFIYTLGHLKELTGKLVKKIARSPLKT